MSNIARLMQLAAGGGGAIDAELSALLAERNISDVANFTTIIETNDSNTFLMFWWRSDYYRGAVVTQSGTSLSIGSEQQLVYNRNWNDSKHAGWRWDSASGAAIGVVVDDGSGDQLKACRVTYSGTSMSYSVSSGFENANSYRLPYSRGPACQYDPVDNVYFAIYGDSSSVYIRPFTVSGSSFSLGDRQSTGLSHNGHYFMNSYYISSTKDLYMVGMNYSGGSGEYWNVVGSTRYSGGTNGTFSATFNNINYNTIGTSTHDPKIVYNEEEGVLWITTRHNTSNNHQAFFPCVPLSNGGLNIGPKLFFNEADPTTFNNAQNNSSFEGAVYDPVSKAVIMFENYSQYSIRLWQVRASGTTLTELTPFATLFNPYGMPTSSVVYDGVNDRTIFAYGNGKDPFNFPSYWVSLRSLSG